MAVEPIALEQGTFDPARTAGRAGFDQWRTFWTAARLGWLMEANWTDPLLFAIYSIAKPLFGVFILVFMVNVISDATSAALRGFVVIGSALWSFVVSGIAGLAQSILDDRERYRMLRYVYVSPSDFSVVVLGRGVARVGVGLIGAAISLAVGIVFLGAGVEAGRIDVPVLVVAMALGLASVVAMALGLASVVAIGVLMASICIQTNQDSWHYPEAVAGALFLVSGAVFPLRVLPDVIQALGLLSPLCWWIEGVRRALVPGSPTGIGGSGSMFERLTGTATPEIGTVLVVLLATGALVTLAAIVAFQASERRAKDRGLFDRTTGS
jgi:ABC-2 type transport system permease protein